MPDSPEGYDDGRRAACRSLLAGPVRSGAARRLVELALAPRDPRDELWEIFDQIDEATAAPTLPALTAVAARAAAAHTCRGTRSLAASVAAISAGIDRRVAACEAGEAGYPLILAGLGAAGRFGLENNLSRVYFTHTLERIVESALLVGTVVEPACAPGAYRVRIDPRASTTDALRSLLGDHLAGEQNATIDFAMEELTSPHWREPGAVDHLQSLLLAVRGPVDVQQLVVASHALLGSACDDVEIEAELIAAARILDGSGLSGEGSLALGGAVGAILGLIGGLASSLFAAGETGGGGGRGAAGGAGAAGVSGSETDAEVGAEGGLVSGDSTVPADPRRSPAGGRSSTGRRQLGGWRSDSGELARGVLRIALVLAWSAEHGRVRPGTIAIEHGGSRRWSVG